ncbi:MAG: choice-of-anchor J domain-containing protein [Bacteroidetes bacterium]|nr:choice-of-anchor J domain-containing protein [Bacteroidota bacterium]
MKKIYSIAALSLTLVTGTALAQSQRFILAEEFTQASCGPCAAQNPAFNTILDANTTKIIGLKYQVWWPGFDPMYNHNKTEVNTRVALYGVTGVPNVRVDGTAYAGAPNGVTQSFIDNRYTNVTSPFTIAATHSFNAAYTQMTINADITCTGTPIGTLVLQTAMIEREINFTTPPGTNGELDFYGVMKKMVPDDQGTAVTAISAGATQNVSLTVDIPWYVYNLNQLAAVLFIQDNASKVVHQAAYSAPIAGLPAVDMQITTVTGIPSLICTGTFSPVVTLKNNAAATITSCNVNYQIDGGAIISQPWTGSLAQNATAQVTINNVSASNGTHALHIFTSDLDAGIDIAPVNHNFNKNFSYSITATLPPVVEGFAASVFPPVDWIVNDNNSDGIGWSRVTNAGGFGNSAQSAKMDFYNSTNGRIDELFIKKIDFQGLTGSASLDFSVAYRQYAAENDRLEVFVSTNCGTSWTSLFNKAGTALSTVPGGQTNAFVPTAAQWRAENVDLTSYLGQAEVLVKFKATSNYGNNMYIDDINLNVTTSIAEAQLENAIKVYPTLTSGLVTIDANFTKEENLKVVVYNAVGQEISSNVYGKTLGGQFIVDLSTFANGNYSVRIFTDAASVVKSISVSK